MSGLFSEGYREAKGARGVPERLILFGKKAYGTSYRHSSGIGEFVKATGPKRSGDEPSQGDGSMILAKAVQRWGCRLMFRARMMDAFFG
jgi:hypothetical protein